VSVFGEMSDVCNQGTLSLDCGDGDGSRLSDGELGVEVDGG
jgi:hypothetical protein